MTKELSTKIANFMTNYDEAEVLMLGRDHICQYSEYALSFLSIYCILIAVVLRDLMLFYFAIVELYLFYDGAVDMQI